MESYLNIYFTNLHEMLNDIVHCKMEWVWALIKSTCLAPRNVWSALVPNWPNKNWAKVKLGQVLESSRTSMEIIHRGARKSFLSMLNKYVEKGCHDVKKYVMKSKRVITKTMYAPYWHCSKSLAWPLGSPVGHYFPKLDERLTKSELGKFESI